MHTKQLQPLFLNEQLYLEAHCHLHEKSMLAHDFMFGKYHLRMEMMTLDVWFWFDFRFTECNKNKIKMKTLWIHINQGPFSVGQSVYKRYSTWKPCRTYSISADVDYGKRAFSLDLAHTIQKTTNTQFDISHSCSMLTSLTKKSCFWTYGYVSI